MSLVDLAFPYRDNREFGVTSTALVFVVLLVEIELVVLLGLAVVAHRFDLFLSGQSAILPAAVLVSLATAIVFGVRARSWSRARIASIGEWSSGAARYGELLAQKHQR
ncbi:MAG: hypothetical protein HY071_03845 [Chloroflexi bacterium]|nr:hypothetical protein [Chloroflexota bacterium]